MMGRSPLKALLAAWARLLALGLCAVAAAVVLVGCSGSVANPKDAAPPVPTIPLAEKIVPPQEGAWIGLFRPPAPVEIRVFDEYKRISDKRPAMLMWYQAWDRKADWEFNTRGCVSTYQRGAVPLITWEPWDPGANARFVENPIDQPRYRLKRIVDGDFDRYIISWARAIKALGGPVMIRPMHEMNGNWYPWGGTVNANDPELFKAAWRHVHRIFAKEGASNVTWVWSINWMSSPDTPDNGYDAYYPGDAYVDWVGISGFNWGTSTQYQGWMAFNEMYRKPLKYLETLDKPIMVAEFASVANGGDKAAWITDAYRRIRTEHPQIKAVVYYDAIERRPTDTQDWRIDRPEEVAAAFEAAVGDPYFLPGPVPELQAWLDQLSAEEKRFLRGVDPGER